MPMIDLKSSRGALPADRLDNLVERLTVVLLKHRQVPDTEQSRRNVWLFVNDLATFVGGKRPTAPHVVLTFTIVAGGMTESHKEALVADATQAIRDVTADAMVWVLIEEVADGHWGANGVITRLADAQSILGVGTSG